MVEGYIFGQAVTYDDDAGCFRYVRDGVKVTKPPRACERCGRRHQYCWQCKDYHDACIGHIDGASSVCCGHGVQQGYVVWE